MHEDDMKEEIRAKSPCVEEEKERSPENKFNEEALQTPRKASGICKI